MPKQVTRGGSPMHLHPTHMVSPTVHSKTTEGLIHAGQRGALTETQARPLVNENAESLALLAASRCIA